MQVKFLAAHDTDAGVLPAGTIVDHPDCFLLADLGMAVEHDAEARDTLARWRAEKPKPGEEDPRPRSWRFAGRDVPTVFTLPSGETRTVRADADGRAVVQSSVVSQQPSVTEDRKLTTDG